FFFSSRRRHTRSKRDWSSDVCSSDLQFAYLIMDGIERRPFLFTQTEVYPVPGLVRLGVKPMLCSEAEAEEGGDQRHSRFGGADRSEERRVGKECRWRWVA